MNHRYLNGGNYIVNITVADSKGAMNRTSVKIKINKPPIAIIKFSPLSPNVTNMIDFNASRSTDSDGKIKDYEWLFGDGATAKGISVNHQYSKNGTYNVTLIVTDDKLSKNQTNIKLRAATPP